MLNNFKYVNKYKVSLHIWNLDFMNWIYIIFGYNSGHAKKKYAKS
jgi:hypothetical protein